MKLSAGVRRRGEKIMAGAAAATASGDPNLIAPTLLVAGEIAELHAMLMAQPALLGLAREIDAYQESQVQGPPVLGESAYVIERCGVFGQGIVGICGSPDAALWAGVQAIKEEKDDYHRILIYAMPLDDCRTFHDDVERWEALYVIERENTTVHWTRSDGVEKFIR